MAEEFDASIQKEGSTVSYFLPSPNRLIRSENDFLREIPTHAGRYKIPLSMKDQLLLRLRSNLSNAPPLLDTNAFILENPTYPIPIEWQAIIQYLHQEGVLAHAQPTFDRLYNDDVKLYAMRVWATPSPTDGTSVMSNGAYSRGVSNDFEEAISKVLGELLERYPQTIYRNKDLYRSSVAALRKKGTHFLDPFLADQFSSWQKERFPSRRFDEASVFSFVRGRSLTKNKPAYIPAQMVYMNYRFFENEPVIRSANSNGAGGMFTYDEAVLSGLHELIQRDAFLLHWLANKTPARIDPESLTDPETKKCLADFRRYHLDVAIVDTTSDLGVPAFIAIILDRGGIGPAVILGGGCGFNQEKAILRALTEAIGVRNWLRLARVEIAPGVLPSVDGVEPFTEDWNMFKRQLLWYGPENLDRIAPFIAAAPESLDRSKDCHFGAPQEELQYIVKKLKERGDAYEVFVYQAKHHVLDALGYASVKVCVPELLPLYLRETYAPLGARRLKEFAAVHTKELSVNTFPHPFP